jgi:hypothetical protein
MSAQVLPVVAAPAATGANNVTRQKAANRGMVHIGAA